jgi:transcriptional regulator with XRE-family HTH domain
MSTVVSTQATVRSLTWTEFGGFLARMRRSRGLSQERLAEQLGCHRTYIWRLEHGRNRPSSVFLHGLKATYKLSPQECDLLNGFEYLRLRRLDRLEVELG